RSLRRLRRRRYRDRGLYTRTCSRRDAARSRGACESGKWSRGRQSRNRHGHGRRATRDPRLVGAPAVFLDRDGTLMEEVNYCSDPKQVKVFPGVAEALVRIKAAGFRTIIITNQAGIARGYITNEQFQAVQAEFCRQLGSGLIDACYVC